MSFKARFLKAEATFLAALTSGAAALNAFDRQWDILLTEFERAMEHSVDKDDADVAFAVSSRIAILGDGLLKLEDQSDDLTLKLLTEIESVLSELSIQDVVDLPEPAGIVFKERTPRRLPQYIPAAFSWLTNNLHDPYPSSSLKRRWAQEAGVTFRVMDDWFKAIRKEIGWVALTRTHFHGSRSLAISTAGSVFGDDSIDPSVPFEAQADLLAARSKLETLYLSERGVGGGLSSERVARLERSRSASLEPSATCSNADLISFSSLAGPPDYTTTAVSTPDSLFTSTLPSLTFDPSDSEDDERALESSIQLFDIPAVPLVSKDVDKRERRLKRTSHSYFDLATANSPESWPTLPGIAITGLEQSTLAANERQIHIAESERPCDAHATSRPSKKRRPTESPQTGLKKRRRVEEDAQPALKKARKYSNISRTGVCRPQAVSAPLPLPQTQASVQSKDLHDLERIFQDLERGLRETPSPAQSVRVLDTSTHVECELSSYPMLESLSSSDNPGCPFDMPVMAIENVSWDQIADIAAAAPVTDVAPLQDKELEELFTSFTSSLSQTEPLFADLGSSDLGLPSTLVLEMQNATESSMTSLGDLSLPGEYAHAQAQDSSLWENLFGFLDANEPLSGEVTIFGEPSPSPISTGNHEPLAPLVNL